MEKLAIVAHICDAIIQGVKNRQICEFKISLVYITNYRIARPT